MNKRLIYTESYHENRSWVFPDGGGEQNVESVFHGRDVRTGEDVNHSNKYWDPYTVYDSFFEENDVLYFRYEPGILITEQYGDEKLTFEEIQQEYQQLKSENISEAEINEIMMKKYSPQTKQR